ncbi:hypothetical protein [Streptacidiphilus melanogenes]|uniref:hypothetical protein n=1 Tax=Streptacidiphilus melanogenes TaxID=411235 RepID=UPI00069414D5|nr:hypothetical protein [Streptacidiphilus melanogenes]
MAGVLTEPPAPTATPEVSLFRVLLEMRGAIMKRRSATPKGLAGLLALLVVVLLMAVSTLLAGVAHYAHQGAGADVVAVLTLGWLLGWIIGPLFAGDDSTLRMDYFKLLPVPADRLSWAMLGAAFADVSLVFSLVAFASVTAYGLRSGAAAGCVGAVATLLTLALAVVSSRAAVCLLGPRVSSRRGRDFGTVVIALAITAFSLASSLVPLAAKILTEGRSPALSATVRVLPSGWGAVAVAAAARSDWAEAVLVLLALAALVVGITATLPALLRRRLTMSTRAGSRTRVRQASQSRPILPTTPFGAVVGKELRLYSRSMMRSVSLMIAFLVGVFVCVIPGLSGAKLMMPFAGLGFAAIAAACFTNLYGDDGTALWLMLTNPPTAAADVRGRQAAWALLVGPLSLVLTVVLTAVSGERWAWPWVLAGEPALVGGAAGLTVWISALSVFPPAADGGPTPQRQLKVNLSLILIPLLTLAPAALPPVLGTVGHSAALRWAGVPVGVVWGSVLWWGLGRLAERTLTSSGPEIFARLRRTG